MAIGSGNKRSNSRFSPNAPISEVSTIKKSKGRKKKNLQFSTHASINDSQMFVSVKGKNSRTEFKISAPNDSVKIQRESNQWKLLYKDKICKLISTYASKESDFVSLGQLVFELIFYNGQRIRIEKDMLTRRRIDHISKAIHKALEIENVPKSGHKLSTIHETLT